MCSVICIAALAFCAVKIFRNETGFGNADAGQYNAGGTTLDAAVENLNIDWTDGKVTIAYHGKDTVEISEKASKPIPEADALRWRLDGGTLYIRYSRPGFFKMHSLKKELTVTLPKNISLDRVSIDATSADVSIPVLHANVIEAALTSGDLSLEQTGSAGSVTLNSTSGTILATMEDAKAVQVTSTSGAIDLSQKGDADSCRISSTSGSVQATLKSAETVEITTTSGQISLEADAVSKSRLDNTSGGITVVLLEFDDLELESTSGNISLALPSGTGFRASIDTASGDFSSSIALKQDGNSYSCGDGSANLRINTTSGNIELTEAKAK